MATAEYQSCIPDQFMRRIGIDLIRKRLNAIRLRRKIRNEAIQAYGGKCCRCGFSDPRALQIDHKEGSGLCSPRKSLGGASGFYVLVEKGITSLQSFDFFVRTAIG